MYPFPSQLGVDVASSRTNTLGTIAWIMPAISRCLGILLLTLTVAHSQVASARADYVLIYDNNVTPNTAYFADAGSSNQRIYDDFTLAGEARVNRITWTGVYANRTNVTDDFTIQIYEANGSLPGTLVSSQNVGNVSEQNIGTLLTRDHFEYGVDITELQLNAGATYFLSITNDTNQGWAWTANNSGGQIAYSPNGGNRLFNFASEMDFELFAASVPEPNAVTMFGIAVVALLGRRRRRKASLASLD